MRKRVGLARAICSQGLEIILYDEPTTGVDPIMGDAINNLVISLHDKLNVTAIAVTHDMNSAYKIADRIAMLYRGKIILTCPAGEIWRQSNETFNNFIHGNVEFK